MTLRNYSDTAPPVTLTANIGTTDTSIPVTSTNGYPAVPFVLGIDVGLAAQEAMLCTSIIDATHFGVTRAYDSTTAAAHTTPATVQHVTTAADAREPNAFINLMNTQGDILIYGASGAQRLGVGAAGSVLTSNGAGANPGWAAIPSKTFRNRYTFNVPTPAVPSGATSQIAPMMLAVPAGQTATLRFARFLILGGTSVTFNVQRAASGVAWASATNLQTGNSATTTMATGATINQALADGDQIGITVTAVSGTPYGFAVTLFIDDTV